MATQADCGVRGCAGAAWYQFASGPTLSNRCRLHGPVYGPVCRRAVRVALVVGTILFAINQSDAVLSGHLTPVVFVKIGLTYLVPFCVSTYSALASNRLRDN